MELCLDLLHNTENNFIFTGMPNDTDAYRHSHRRFSTIVKKVCPPIFEMISELYFIIAHFCNWEDSTRVANYAPYVAVFGKLIHFCTVCVLEGAMGEHG